MGLRCQKDLLDLRSDTVTQPTAEMRAVMHDAPVGDCLYGEDPSTNRLELAVAQMFGKDDAVFVPSGTMSNQIGLRLLGNPGDSVLVPSINHIVRYESGAMAALNGLQVQEPKLDQGFLIDEGALAQSVVPDYVVHASRTAFVAIENTHMGLGGRVYPFERLQALSGVCKSLGLPLHCDGARLWNAQAVEGHPFEAYGALFDTLSVCFSKGLGAPVGSCLVGSRAHIGRARKIRKMFGGTMRQCGSLAAAAQYAIENHMPDLKKDHTNAKALARFYRAHFPLAKVPEPETNIVLLDVSGIPGCEAQAVVGDLLERFGLRVMALGPTVVRSVLHRDITQSAMAQNLGSQWWSP